ncbi:MAG TPA: PAS domain S-box protein [Xanthobacteraceae bacterium]|nr:PAS domain S-box protein [Xanthobacteraceae bacterium]
MTPLEVQGLFPDDLFRLAMEACPSGMVVSDPTGTILMVNAETERLFGYSRQELIGQSIDLVVPQRLREDHSRHRAAFIADAGVRAMGAGRELFGLRKDGSEVPVEVGLRLVATRAGLVILSVIVDITVRKRAETEQKIAQAQFRLAVEACPSGMVMVDAAGQIAMVNAKTEQMFGYSRQELIGQRVDILVPTRFRDRHSGLRAAFAANPAARAMGMGRDLHGRRQDNSEFPVEVGLHPIETCDGWAVLGVIVDVSERKHAELLAASQRQDLERSNAELEEFAYVAAHELLEPLRTIAGYADLLAERYQGKLDEKADKYIQFAVGGAKGMQSLIIDLLASSRLGRRARPLQPTDSAAVVRQVIERLRPRIEETKADIAFGPLPVVNADETQLAQVLQNLIGNALKFRSTRPPRIRLSASPRNGEWLFSVEDNGIGIDQQFADRIFQMFQRLHERGKYEGSGIGLAIAKKIVERHGGKIWFESQLGTGTTFYFTLPDPAMRTSN